MGVSKLGILKQRGLTSVELLAVGAIFLLLVAGVVPKMNDYSRKTEMYDVHKSIFSALHVARSEAVGAGRRVFICASSDGKSCTTDGWSKGWLVLSEAKSGKKNSDNTHEIIQYFANQSEFYPSVFDSNYKPVHKIGFNSEGYSTVASRLMSVVCDFADENAFNFALTVNRSGYVVASNVSEFIDQQMGGEVTAAQAAQNHCSRSSSLVKV